MLNDSYSMPEIPSLRATHCKLHSVSMQLFMITVKFSLPRARDLWSKMERKKTSTKIFPPHLIARLHNTDILSIKLIIKMATCCNAAECLACRDCTFKMCLSGFCSIQKKGNHPPIEYLHALTHRAYSIIYTLVNSIVNYQQYVYCFIYRLLVKVFLTNNNISTVSSFAHNISFITTITSYPPSLYISFTHFWRFSPA